MLEGSDWEQLPYSGAAGATATAPVLRTRSLTKRFPGVLAVDDVDLDIEPGRILALLGPNGAGKSTLIQVLAGAHPAGTYDGQIELLGRSYEPENVAAAVAAGVVLIPQEINTVPDMTVAQNLYLNRMPTRFGMVDWNEVQAGARRLLADFEIGIAADARMGSLDLATQQLVTIVRALSKDARVLILDEPTAPLTGEEAGRLFDHLRTLRARGVAIVFVSHRLAEVFAIADRIVVMRDGRIRGDHPVAETTREAVVAEMVGSIEETTVRTRSVTPGTVALEVRGLTVCDVEEPDRQRVSDVSLVVHRGEIVGLFGLVGAGCGPTATAIFGAWPGRVSGEIRIDGHEVQLRTPTDAVAAGLALMSQDRRQTLVLDLSIADNVALASLGALTRWGFLDVERKHLIGRQYVDSLAIRAPSADTSVGTLSGGNQQKVQVARWLVARSDVLLLDDPTRGVDVGARAEIHRLIRNLAADGKAILLVSSEAEELIDVCDRIHVMRAGRLVAELGAAVATESALLEAAAGQ
jgi:ABC-type sugar transport system ATPase subunit